MLCFICVTFILTIYSSSLIIADDPCRYTGSKGTIDLTSLGKADGTPAFPDSTPIGSSYRYSYNPCKPFSEGDTCKDVAVCQVSLDGKYTFVLGKQDNASWNPGAGLGSSPTLSYGFDQKKVTITLECSKDGTSDFEALGESPINTYKFNLKHECACWDGCAGSSSTKSPGGGGGGTAGGLVFIIILIVLLVVYFIGFAIYYRVRENRTGTELIAHKTFWVALPGYAKDGAVYAFQRVTGKGGSNYQSV